MKRPVEHDQGRPASERPQDPGAYIGHEPELAADTIPGGVRPEDERVAAYDSQPDTVVGDAEDPDAVGDRVERDEREVPTLD